MKNIQLSVVVSTYNSENILARCLESVAGLADEIIVINNSSSDTTEKVAKQFTEHVYTRPNNLMLNINKNYGFSKATGKWILNLDDDESLTQELAEEIRQILSSEHTADGYWLPRKNIIFGKWIEHTGWYPDHQLRLFKKDKGRFSEVHVHEMIQLDGKAAYLQQAMTHQNYSSIHQFLSKAIQIYTINEADVLAKKQTRVSSVDALRFPFREFISRYFSLEGYKDGVHGLVLSLLMAFYHFIVFCLLWEKQQFSEEKADKVFADVSAETQQMEKEVRYWLYTVLLSTSSTSAQKLSLRIKRKLLTQKIKK